MKEIKNQPIDGRTKKQYYARAAAILIIFPVLTAVLCVVVRTVAEKAGYEEHTIRLTAVLIAVMTLLLIRSLYRNNIRKWCFAYVTYVYDCMERDDTDHCPRCSTMFAMQYGEEKGKKKCPNSNCDMSLDNRIPYSKLPATVYGAKALVLNAGVKDDFKPSIARDIGQFLISFAVYLAVSVFCVYFIAPRLIDAAKQLIDLI